MPADVLQPSLSAITIYAAAEAAFDILRVLISFSHTASQATDREPDELHRYAIEMPTFI
jgi:hypothetical protein